MARIVADRVLETSTTTGTGSYTLAGAVLGYRAASAVCANGDTITYYAEDVNVNGVAKGDWEIGIGTWSTGGTLARTTIVASSNSNAAVSWVAGTRRIGLGIISTPSLGNTTLTGYLDATPITAPTWVEGRVFYDTDAHTLNYFNDNSQMSVNIGQEQIVRVRNKTGVTIDDGSVVYVSGAVGQTPNITLAIATSLATAAILGVTTTTMLNNEYGYVTINGLVNNLNTVAFADGALVYLSAVTAGTYSAVSPDYPNYSVQVGIVLHSHTTQGKLLVSPQLSSTEASHIIGTIAVNQGGTGQTTALAAFNALSPLTTEGDLVVGGALGSAGRLSVGGANTVLHGGTTPTYSAIVKADINLSATSRVLGRITAGAGSAEELTGANLATIIGITNTAANVTSVNGTTGAVTLTNLGLQNFTSGATVSGSNTGDNAVNTLYSGLVTNATHTGDATGATALTLASIIVAGGPTGSTSVVPVITWDAKGRLTAVTTATITPASIGAQASGTYVTSVGVTAPVASTGGTAPTISMAAATSIANGYMTSTYASKLDGIAAGATANTGTVTGVTGTAPVVSSGGTAPAISMAAASSGINGYMTGTYATKLDGIAASATNVTNTNQLTNGAGYITSAGTSAACSGTAANATTAGGLAVHAGVNNEVNKIVRTNASGYCDFGWINTISGVATGTPARVYCSEDAYLRYYSMATFTGYVQAAATGSWGISVTGSSGSTTGNAATVTSAPGRTDGTAYPVVWNTTGGVSQNYSCTAVNIQSSTGTLNATNFTATGSVSAATKSFLIPHPTKAGMKLRYGSLEGPENGVYIRGRLSGNTIELPEYWTKLVDPDSITVSLTSVGKHQDLYVDSIADNKIVVGNQNLFSSKIDCFYVVYGERVDVEKLVVEF